MAPYRVENPVEKFAINSKIKLIKTFLDVQVGTVGVVKAYYKGNRQELVVKFPEKEDSVSCPLDVVEAVN